MQALPLIPSVVDYAFATTLDGVAYSFRFYWNDRDAAWFFDAFDGDALPIMYGVKVVLGTNLGRTYDHPLVRTGALMAIDLSGELRDATFDDLGDRVIVIRLTATEMAAAHAEALAA